MCNSDIPFFGKAQWFCSKTRYSVVCWKILSKTDFPVTNFMVPGDAWGEGGLAPVLYTQIYDQCVVLFVGYTMPELVLDINSCIVGGPLKERTWKVEKQSCSITIILNLLEDRTLFLPPDVPEDSFVGCIDISGTVVVSYILTGVHVWFLFILFYYFFTILFKMYH